MESQGQMEEEHAVNDEMGRAVEDSFLPYLLNPHKKSPWPNEKPGDPHYTMYQKQLEKQKEDETITVSVDFKNLAIENADLSEAIRTNFYELTAYLQRAVNAYVNHDSNRQILGNEQKRVAHFSFVNMDSIMALREMRSDHIGMLTSISGTVTRTTDVKPELILGGFTCDLCGERITGIEQQFQFTKPQTCPNKECHNRSKFTFELRDSIFADWQKVKMQENTNEIPAGSMPRGIDLILRDSEVEKVKPGDRIVACGSLIVIPDVSQLYRQGQGIQIEKVMSERGNREEGITGLAALGVRTMLYKCSFLCSSITSVSNVMDDYTSSSLEQAEAWKQQVMNMRSTALLYQRLSSSIAPTIYGHDDIKRAILLMLAGGVHKITEDGGSIRGDINVCIVGDPSTAKSQFLKYVNSITPRSIYTSGKSSSAAGLTVGIGRDADTGELCLEAGALMLSDNGICCIDEFDKMDYGDQVAIHEAMEQQTISITKAGIQATLNARTSILAAANPIGGKYDRTKSLKNNINITAPLMSRFDLFFIILDECDTSIDHKIASHIIRNHMKQEEDMEIEDDENKPYFSTEEIQHYLSFARLFDPKFIPESEEMLVECYRILRQNDAVGTHNQSSYRITVRQLESLIRLSEALARIHLDDIVQVKYVKEAFRLLRQSIIHIESKDVDLGDVENWEEPVVEAGNTMEEEKGDAADAADAADTAAQEERKPEAVSFEEYKDIANKLVVMIRGEKARLQSEAGQQEQVMGVAMGYLLNMLLKNYRIEDPDELLFQKKKIRMIVQRLIRKDHVLIINCDIADKPEEEWIVDVHPNYVLS